MDVVGLATQRHAPVRKCEEGQAGAAPNHAGVPTDELTAREKAVLDALLVTIAPQGCDFATASAALRVALDRTAPHRLAKLRPLLHGLGGPLLPFMLAGRFAPFTTLDLPTREQVLRAMADSPLGPLRSAFQALKRLCLFVAYAAVDDRTQNPLWPVIGYPGPRADRVVSRAPLVLSALQDGTIECDVAVVGSGAGGGVAAAALAGAGKKVVVLEAGPPADAKSLTQLESDAFANFYLDSALTASTDLSVAVLAGACVGGGTTVNWCTSLRLPERIAGQWRSASGGIDFFGELAAHYDAVSKRLGIRTTSDHNANNAVLQRGCRALGWHTAELPRNAFACGEGCGYCGFGCAYGNKQSTAQTYLQDAVAAGAAIYANARVDRVVIERGRAIGVDGMRAGNRPLRVRASTVIVSAGSLRTPGILRASGMTSRHVGRHLKLHPTTSLFALFDEPIETWHGPMQTVVSDQFGDLDDGYGAKLEAVPAHPGLAAYALPWRSQRQHAELMCGTRNAAALIVLTRDRGEGTVGVDGRADIRYLLDRYDAGNMLTALAGLVEIVFAAGAKSVVTLHTDPLEMTRERASKANLDAFGAELRKRGASPNRLGVFSAHQMGTCRMHRDARLGVVDERGGVHGVSGLYVADASVFPDSSGVNPMLTIMALAHRTSHGLM